MHEDVTLVGAGGAGFESTGGFATLPPDLVGQMPRRVQLLGALFFVAFAFDPLFLLLARIVSGATGRPLPPALLASGGFRLLDAGAALASAGLWWTARRQSVRPRVLHTLGLWYLVLICLEISIVTYWQFYLERHTLPNLTWVPAVVIVFPLVLPGPPRRMTLFAIGAAAMSPLALALLDLTGRVTGSLDAYVGSLVASAFAVVFAGMGSRLIYGLGRQVIAARELGSYRLEAVLGEGGMGEVWRASHRMLVRPAAIKLIRSSTIGEQGAGSAEARARFEREAQAIALLRSPHTVDLYDFGVTDRGVFYYAMELLEGLDAQRLVREFGPLPTERVVHVLRQVCHSLSEAHGRGLVHRDIKPANIVLCRYGEDFDFVKVLDFGLVTALLGSGPPDPRLTGAHAVQGTPSFIAPEQAMGVSEVDGRADIYATGCLAYWLLTGQPVFLGDSPVSLLVHHASTTPEPPSRRTELPIPEPLDRLVLSCLAKDPDERPPSARVLAELLNAIELPVAWTADRAREWWALHQPEEAGLPAAREPARGIGPRRGMSGPARSATPDWP